MLLTSLDAPGVPGGALAWPGARAMFDNAFDLNLERRIKYLWRLALTWNVRGRLLRESPRKHGNNTAVCLTGMSKSGCSRPP